MITVRSRNSVTRQEWDLTPFAEGLSWSSVNPGGDEQCTFTLPRVWFTGAPEVQLGNLLIVADSLNELFRGRIENNSREVENVESIGITAFGLGARLKDSYMYEVYVDSDFAHWGPASAQLKLNLNNSGYRPLDASPTPDDTTGAPCLRTAFPGATTAGGMGLVEAFYDAGTGVTIGSVYYAWKKNTNVDNTNVNYGWFVFASTDDIRTSTDSSGSLRAAGPSTGTLTTTGGNKRYANVEFVFAAAGLTTNVDYALFWTCLAVYGSHGLTKQGAGSATAPPGLLASDIISNAVGRVSGIAKRRIDATTFSITQCEYRGGARHEDVVTDVNKYHNYDWGTWGNPDCLEITNNGYFQFTAPDSATAHWIARRAETDDDQLTVELSTLHNSIDVIYTDPGTGEQRVTRTATVQELDDSGISRTEQLNVGTTTTAGAQQLGDIELALTGSFAPARGTITISGMVRHYQRGPLPVAYLRADGSNILLSDVLSSKDSLSLNTATADRRALFPIKRVTIDCSGDKPVASIEVDQGTDYLATLTARLEQVTNRVL